MAKFRYCAFIVRMSNKGRVLVDFATAKGARVRFHARHLLFRDITPIEVPWQANAHCRFSIYASELYVLQAVEVKASTRWFHCRVLKDLNDNDYKGVVQTFNVLVTRHFPVRFGMLVHTSAIMVASDAVKASWEHFRFCHHLQILLSLLNDGSGRAVHAAQAVRNDQYNVFRSDR